MNKNIFVNAITQTIMGDLKSLLYINTLGFFSLGALTNPKPASIHKNSPKIYNTNLNYSK